MAGPVCSVLIAQAQGVPELIEELIDLVSEPHDHGWMAQLKEESRDRHFAVMHTTSIGGSYIGDGEPYMLCVEPFSVERDSLESSAADNANMAQTIGWVPQCQVDVIAFCSGDHNHRIVAELALWLAERTAGVIDLGDEVPEVHAPGVGSAGTA